MSKIFFFITYSLGGILRNRKRYTLLGVILYTVTAVVIGSLLLSTAARQFYQSESARIGDIALADDETREYFFSEVKSIEGLSVFGNIMILAFSFLGVITLVFVTMLLQNERIYEAGILYALGMNRIYIYFSMLFETVVFILSMVLLGLLTASGVLYLLFALTVLPDLRVFINARGGFVIGIFSMSFVLTVIPSLMLLVRVSTSSPVKLLK